MLQISPKLFVPQPSLGVTEHPCFHIETNKLTLKGGPISGKYLTTLSEIIEKINLCAKPQFSHLESFQQLMLNLKKINVLHPSHPIRLKDFCLQLSPVSTELEDKIWAVHASTYLWPDAVLRPYGRSLNSQKQGKGLALTIHFSLGEMVRPHSLWMTWEQCDFVLLTPLKNILKQTLNISPHDTYIIGDWKIPAGSLLIAPENVKIPEVYAQKNITVVTYNPALEKIRKVVRKQIQAQAGLEIKMVKNLILPGSPAYLNRDEALNINHPNFFSSLWNDHPSLSFGCDVISLKGKGFCLGMISQLSEAILLNEDDPDEKEKLYVYYCYIDFSYGLIKKQLTAVETTKIESFLEKYKKCLELPPSNKILPFYSDLCMCMSMEDIQQLTEKYPRLFDRQGSYWKAEWAAKRLLMLGEELGRKENLESLYRESLAACIEEEKQKETFNFRSGQITKTIFDHIEQKSERASLALHLLDLPETLHYNTYVFLQDYIFQRLFSSNIAPYYGNPQKTETGYTFFHPQSVEEALKGYSLTQKLLDKHWSEMELFAIEINAPYDGPTCRAYNVYHKLTPVKIETDLEQLKSSHSALTNAIAFFPSEEKIKELTDIKISNCPAEGTIAAWLNFYGSPTKMWKALGLEKAFSITYKDEKEFFKSDLTFMEMVQKLESLRQKS